MTTLIAVIVVALLGHVRRRNLVKACREARDIDRSTIALLHRLHDDEIYVNRSLIETCESLLRQNADLRSKLNRRVVN